jgi:hypothetical protein
MRRPRAPPSEARLKYLSLIAHYATLGTVVVGVVFGILTTRHAHRVRALNAAVELVHSIQTPEFTRAIELILELPENSRPAHVLADRTIILAAYMVSHVFESLGVLVFYHLLPLHLVDHLVGGYVRASWQRLEPYITERRQTLGASFAEWFQWLVERMREYPVPCETEGAAVAHRDWKPGVRGLARLAGEADDDEPSAPPADAGS